jgi:hypothetical protein
MGCRSVANVGTRGGVHGEIMPLNEIKRRGEDKVTEQ